jgi:type IV fimbrial biogenesis protein FimT
METTDEMVVKRMSGFTLVEMAVVMTIVAILVGIAAPSFRSVTTSNRVSGEINGLLGDMQYARSEALKEGQTVTICSSTDGINCGTAAWDQGWFVFSDPTDAKTGGATVQALRVQKGFLGGDTLQFDNKTSAITFNREGFAMEPMKVATAAITATLHDKTNTASKTRCLVITAGRIATETPGPASATQLTACQ